MVIYQLLKRRFIPTRVGSMLGLGHLRGLSSVHPHSRGEHQCPQCEAYISPGSSPLAWGASDSPSRVDPLRRFIPTRVGSILWRGW